MTNSQQTKVVFLAGICGVIFWRYICVQFLNSVPTISCTRSNSLACSKSFLCMLIQYLFWPKLLNYGSIVGVTVLQLCHNSRKSKNREDWLISAYVLIIALAVFTLYVCQFIMAFFFSFHFNQLYLNFTLFLRQVAIKQIS